MLRGGHLYIGNSSISISTSQATAAKTEWRGHFIFATCMGITQKGEVMVYKLNSTGIE